MASFSSMLQLRRKAFEANEEGARGCCGPTVHESRPPRGRGSFKFFIVVRSKMQAKIQSLGEMNHRLAQIEVEPGALYMLCLCLASFSG